jgi:steroid delta-isomerase-like uncharacterized protein
MRPGRRPPYRSRLVPDFGSNTWSAPQLALDITAIQSNVPSFAFPPFLRSNRRTGYGTFFRSKRVFVMEMSNGTGIGTASALAIAHRYFDGWNRRDASIVLETMGPGGTYSDPQTGGPLGGEPFREYMNRLFASFPDVSFEIASEGLLAPDLVAAQWIMRGTNTGSMMGLPPTGKPVMLHGADFIRVSDGRIRSVEGYFDSRAIPEQLGLQVLVQPRAIGPFTFGRAARVSAGSAAKPGAFSITALRSRDAADEAAVSDRTRRISTELLGMKGFISLVTAVCGDRMLTITAWEHPEDPRQLMKGGEHGDAMKQFFGKDLGGGGYTAVFVPERINAMWVRCPDCQKMVDYATSQGACGCGATLPQPLAYW